MSNLDPINMEQPEPPTVFDSPQWKFRLVPETAPPDVPGSHELSIHRGAEDPEDVRVVLPPEFYSFAKEIIGCDDIESLYLYVEELRVRKQKRWYLGVEYVDKHTNCDLWYWTASNKPGWL